MSSYVMPDCQFEYLLSRINQETDSSEKKLHTLYQSNGRFSGFQTTRILYAFGLTCDRLKALEIMENRMITLSSCDAKSIIGTFSIPDDQLKALIIIKRHICDLSEICSQENILSCFIFPSHKQRAKEILHVSKLTSKDMISAGGHAIYSPFGSVLTQAPPLDPVLYSTIYMNSYSKPSQDKFKVEKLGLETCCRPPAFLDPCCETEDQNCTAQPSNCCVFCECPAKRPLYNHYPSGAAPLGLHNPTAKIGLDRESKCYGT